MPKQDVNLISYASMDLDGYSTHFVDGKCEIRIEIEVMCTAQLENGLLVLKNAFRHDTAKL